MKNIVFIMVLALGAYVVPGAFAQNHGEVGVFADFVRLLPIDTNNLVVGGRPLCRGQLWPTGVHPNVQLEGEMSYDFARNFTERFTLGPAGSPTGSTGFSRTGIRILHGLFGPKFQTGGEAIRAFGTIKGGFVNFRLDNRPATFGTFTSSVDSLRRNNVNGVVYPAGGVEFYAGPFGIRAEVGDLMYFRDGVHNNLRIAAGPSIRF